jgi:hypothetical protein
MADFCGFFSFVVTSLVVSREGCVEDQVDVFYVGIAILFFAGSWLFTKACDRL